MQLVGYTDKKKSWHVRTSQAHIQIPDVTYRTNPSGLSWAQYTGYGPVFKGWFNVRQFPAYYGTLCGVNLVEISTQDKFFVEIADIPALMHYILNNNNHNGACEIEITPKKKNSSKLRWKLAPKVYEETDHNVDVLEFWRSVK